MTVKPVPPLTRERQTEMYRRALRIMPGGTDSNPTRGRGHGLHDRGKGATIWDIDGNSTSTRAWATVRPFSAAESALTPMSSSDSRGVSFSPTSEDEDPGPRADHRDDLL
jgi:hypothetical protein